MKKTIRGSWIGKATHAFLFLLLLFTITHPTMDRDLLAPISIDQETNQENIIENEPAIEERVNYSPPHHRSPIGKAMAPVSGFGSGLNVAEEFRGYNTSVATSISNTETDLDTRESSPLTIEDPSGYAKRTGDKSISNITIYDLTASSDWRPINTTAGITGSVELNDGATGDRYAAMEFSIVGINFSVDYIRIYYSGSWPDTEHPTLAIYNKNGTSGEPDSEIASTTMTTRPGTPTWISYSIAANLTAGNNYFVVINATSFNQTSIPSANLWWEYQDDSVYPPNDGAFYVSRDVSPPSWDPFGYDMICMIQGTPWNFTSNQPLNYTNPWDSNLNMTIKYDSGFTENLTLGMGNPFTITQDSENFTFSAATSVNFNANWSMVFWNSSFPTANYTVDVGTNVTWDVNFTSTDLIGWPPTISYSLDWHNLTVSGIPNRTSTDWELGDSNVTKEGSSVPAENVTRVGTELRLIAGGWGPADWHFNATSPNYVSTVDILDVDFVSNATLGDDFRVRTNFTNNTPMGISQQNVSIVAVTPPSVGSVYNGSVSENIDSHTTNILTFDNLWPAGNYTFESHYNGGVEAGVGQSSQLPVYSPTSLTVTSIPSSRLKGSSFTIQVRFINTANNSGIGGATVTFTPAWGGTYTPITNTNGYAETTIPTTGAPLGYPSISISVPQNNPLYYRGASTSPSIHIIQSASLYGLSYKSAIGYNDSTTIQVSYAAAATVTITIDGNQKSMGGVGGGSYSYTFVGTEWGLGPHQFTINANKPDHTFSSVSGSINVGNNPTELRTTGLYASSVTFPDLQNDSTLQLAYTDTFELSLAYVDLVHNTTTGNASLTFDWMVGELPSVQSGAGGNYTLSIEGTTIGKHTLAINMSQYGHQPQEFVMTFDIVNNPTTLSIDPTIPTNRTLSIEYSEEALFRLYIEDTNHTLPLSITPTVNGWTNYSVVESPAGNYSFTFYGDWVTPEEGQPVDIVFQPYGYEPQTFSFTLKVQHRTIIMTVEVEGLEGTTDEFNMIAGESIFVNVQLNYTNWDPVPNVDVIAIFKVGSKSSQGSSPSLALNAANLQDAQLQSFNITGTTDKQGWVVLAFKTTADMHNVQKIEVVFEGDATNGAVGMEFSTVNIRIIRPSLLDMLMDYWYLTVAAAILIMMLIWYLIRITRRRLVYRVELERKIQRTYDFIMDIVNLDAIIGILRDGTAFYDLMIGEELDPQLYSSFLTALRTYASTTVTARPVEVEDELYAEVVGTEEKAHALMGDKESYIASGELISFAFVFTARFDETGQWQSISPITRETALEAVEEIEVQFESEILQFQDGRDLSAIPGDHIYLGFSNILGLDFLKPHLTTRREKGLTKEEQKALKVARDIEALEGQILLQLVAERLIGEGMVKERAIYALQQLRVKGGVETVERRQAEEAARLEEVSEFEESAEEEESSLYQDDDI